MKLPKFTKESKNENPTPPWIDELAEDDYISCNTTYVMGGYWDRFDECVAPREEELQGLDNCLCFFPEWIRNEDKGVASVNYGIEMGQHCIINPVQANLIYNDGTCYDERLPKGVTGWIKEVVEQ